jgi:hypothetical protein
MGAGPALGCSWAKSNPEHAPIIRNRCIAIATPFHGQNSLIITWIGAAPPPLGQLRPISSSPQVARQCSSKGHSGPEPLERAVMTASTEWESPWDLAASVAPEPKPRGIKRRTRHRHPPVIRRGSDGKPANRPSITARYLTTSRRRDRRHRARHAIVGRSTLRITPSAGQGGE